jgi:hypothetical protein
VAAEVVERHLHGRVVVAGQEVQQKWKSLKTDADWTIATETTMDRSSEKTTWKNSHTGPAPSMFAASSTSREIVATNALNSRTQNKSP